MILFDPVNTAICTAVLKPTSSYNALCLKGHLISLTLKHKGGDTHSDFGLGTSDQRLATFVARWECVIN